MNKSLLERIAQTFIIKILQRTPAPRWITFCADLIISIVSTSVVLSAFSNETHLFSHKYLYPVSATIIIVVFALSNLITGAYKCIVRFAVIEDILKSFYCVLSSTLTLLMINYMISCFREYHLIVLNYEEIMFIGVITLCLMILARLLVKILYSKVISYQSDRMRVIIMGSDVTSLSVASTLRNEVGGRYLPVALLSMSDEIKFDQMNGIPIERYGSDNIGMIFKRYDCQTLIVSREHLKSMGEDFVNNFINNDIRLMLLSQAEEFRQDNLGDNEDISPRIKQARIEDLLGRPEIITDRGHIHESIIGKVVLITGAAGSIGSEIVRQVAQMNVRRLILIDQAETPMHNLQLELEKRFSSADLRIFIADIRNHQRIDNIFKEYRPDYVYHAAAYKHVPMMESNPSEAIKTNVIGTKHLADIAVKYGTEKFVMISTDKAVNPTNVMGASKRLAEIYVQSLFYHSNEAKTKFITTRFGNVLGSNGSVIPHFRRQIEQGGPVTITHRDIIRYFMTVQEACSLVLEVGTMGNGGEIFVFDMGKPIRIYDLAKRMITLAGLKLGEDIKIVETGLRPGEKLYEELLNNKEHTIETRNKKIMIAKVRKYDFSEVNHAIDQIIRFAEDGDDYNMIYNIKQLIPEFISNNSSFETIDNEIRIKQQQINEISI